MKTEQWIPFDGIARIEGDIVYLTANDCDDKLWSALEDVKIDGDSVYVRLGGFIHGGTCDVPKSL